VSERLFKRLLGMRIVRFGLVGGVSTIIHIVAAFMYIYFVNDQVFAANLVGF